MMSVFIGLLDERKPYTELFAPALRRLLRLSPRCSKHILLAAEPRRAWLLRTRPCTAF